MKRGDQPGIGKKATKQGPATKKQRRIVEARKAEQERLERGAA